MAVSRRSFLKLTGVTAAASISLPQLAWMMSVQQQTDFFGAIDPVLHLVNRLTWGARPDEVEHAKSLGYEAYLEEQLYPQSIDDSQMDARLLRDVPILQLSRSQTYALTDNSYRTYLALTEGMVLRAVHSKCQLLERMVEFWTDHFNIPSDERGPDLVILHRDVLRRHALGNFRDLLFGTAQNPAMLYYLDNYLNIAEHPNENYARELMELHTLGVDGGYTEQDVREVARAFTGWTVREGTDTGFYFDPNVHDSESKTVLGHELPAGRGIEDGLHVLSIVANHPATAYYLCYKLCRRFVSDTPPLSLVESAAAIWIETHGEIIPVLRHIFLSEDFRQSAGQKLRRPLDFFIGALRASGTEFHDFYAMEHVLLELAQLPYGWHPPDGYPDVAAAWMNSSALLARWNAAMVLTHDALSNPDVQQYVTSHLMERIGQPATVGELVDAAAWQVFAAALPAALRSSFVAFVSDGEGANLAVTPHLLARKLGTLFGLLLASPLYQWR
ncbi:MAG: DUF1800 domain-containing protein [Chloroflexi bacterium]|nr:DUF1800 domain-containing protein [Chloroflexota bacterium]